jgi:hypothetical protein
MRLQFNLVVKGNDNLTKKFEETIQNHPTFHIDLIQAFGQSIMLALRLTKEDEISIESFRAGQIPDDPIPETPQVEKIIDVSV